MPTIFRRVFVFLFRLAAVLVGAAVALGLLLLGLLLTAGLIAWSLVRGRRPRVQRFRVDPRQPFGGFRPRGPAANAEVVDVEAREVPSTPPQRLGGDRS